MTEFETRLSEFREDFRKAALNGFIPYTVEEEFMNEPYIATITYHFTCDGVSMTAKFCVAPTFVCHMSELLNGVFKEQDIPALLELINNRITLDAERRQRLKDLKAEIMQLEKEFRDGTEISVAS